MQTTKPNHLILTAVLAALSTNTGLRAGTVTPRDSLAPIVGGIGYRWTVLLGETDSASASRHVGAWSWEDQSLFGVGDDPVGWTHTSDWVALTLTSATTFTLRLERDANVSQPISGDPLHLADTESFYPSFTIWSGWDNDLMPADVATALGYVPATANDHHTWNNDGAVVWAEDLTYVGCVSNSLATSAEATYTLPAGQYSIALGSNAAATDPDRQGYRATFTSVPELGTAAMLLAGLGTLALRRRRTSSEVSEK